MGLLDQIHSPADVRALPIERLPALAAEIRKRILDVVGRRGGHLTSNLGVTELTIALHRTFDSPHDIILWDPTQYVEIEKGGMQSDQSIHVRFTTNENTFRFITRVDGQPLWNSALTPFAGSNTQSPQTVLATRA
jgi:hypothetical protein